MLSALFIGRMAAGENHMEEFLIDHGVIGLDIELIEEAEESATQEPRRVLNSPETIPKSIMRYCNYPLPPGQVWYICKTFLVWTISCEYFHQVPYHYWGATRCSPRPEESTVPGNIVRPCFWYDPYCQYWWEDRETERENGIEGDWTYCINNGTYVSSAKCNLDEHNVEMVMRLGNGTGVFWRYKASDWWETEEYRRERQRKIDGNL
jgi:hypothetical protein